MIRNRNGLNTTSPLTALEVCQVLMDVAMHHAGVTIILDRAGVTGDDGASHNGMWDLSILGLVPGARVAAPRDEETLRRALREAVARAPRRPWQWPAGRVSFVSGGSLGACM